MVYLLPVRVACCYKFQPSVGVNTLAIHGVVAHDFLDQADRLCCVCFIEEQNRVNSRGDCTIVSSKSLCLSDFRDYFSVCCPTVYLKDI